MKTKLKPIPMAPFDPTTADEPNLPSSNGQASEAAADEQASQASQASRGRPIPHKFGELLWSLVKKVFKGADHDDFRDTVLGLVFYKYLSDQQHRCANKLLSTDADLKNEKFSDYTEIDSQEFLILAIIQKASVEELGYFLSPNQLMSALVRKGGPFADGDKEDNEDNSEDWDNFEGIEEWADDAAYVLDDLEGILKFIGDSAIGLNGADGDNHLFDHVALDSSRLSYSSNTCNAMILRLLRILEAYDFQQGWPDSNVYSEVFEYLCDQFQYDPIDGKKMGDFYTHPQFSRVLAELAASGKPEIESAYDPACGTGSLVLHVAENRKVNRFAGQELNQANYNLAHMNMIINGVPPERFDLRREDTLKNPQHLEERFEAVVAHLPRLSIWWGSPNPNHQNDIRFNKYLIATDSETAGEGSASFSRSSENPNLTADYAFILHILHQLADNGTAAVMLNNEVLFRRGVGQKIRQRIIEDLNYLDAVIGLSSKLSRGTPLPFCILVFKKNREPDSNILFIDAIADIDRKSLFSDPRRKKKYRLSEAQVDKIVKTHESRETVSNFSYAAPMAEVADNLYKLNVARYVNTSDEEPVDIEEMAAKFGSITKDMHPFDAKIEGFCADLKIANPFAS